MSDIKDRMIEAAVNDPANWITRKCAVCNDPVKINVVLTPGLADLEEPCICPRCLNKE